MKVKKKVKGFVALLMCVAMLLGNFVVANAAGEAGIMNNGLNGIWIDISKHPFTTYGSRPDNYDAYGPRGCGWYATSRASNITGRMFPVINNGVSWYNTKAGEYGYNKGKIVWPNSLACYENHIAVVEKIQGDMVTISEGGYNGTGSGPANGYCVIRQRHISEMGSAGPDGGKLLGYVYLYDTPTVSLNWVNLDCKPGTTDAYIYIEAQANASGQFGETGITVWDENNNVVASKKEQAVSGNRTNLPIWYNITAETGAVLKQGTTYKYQIYTTFGGKVYKTDIKSFRTTGQAANSWTQELNIENWTYGTTAKAPTAKAKYGTPVYSYTTGDGFYTTLVPTSAGTYYVQANVTETNDYTGLTAEKKFTIYKATPTYTVPTGLTAVVGQTLADIQLPKGFTWQDAKTTSVGSAGTHTFKVTYTPTDTINYNIVTNITVTLTVKSSNTPPTITANNITLTVGDKFDVKKGVTASDKEDGDITKNIEVVTNTVNTSKPGTYKVTYKITDSQGAYATKTIMVTVKAKEENQILNITLNGQLIDGNVAYVKLPSVGMLYKNHSATLGFKFDKAVDVKSVKWSYDSWSASKPEANIESPDSVETVIRPNGKGVGARSTWVKLTVTDTDGNVYEKTVKVRFYKWDWQRK